MLLILLPQLRLATLPLPHLRSRLHPLLLVLIQLLISHRLYQRLRVHIRHVESLRLSLRLHTSHRHLYLLGRERRPTLALTRLPSLSLSSLRHLLEHG